MLKNSKWEQRLNDLANSAACNEAGKTIPLPNTGRDLQQSFEACAAITAEHSRSFYLASGLLPAEKRSAMRALYAFCRTADDLADGDTEQPGERLCELRQGITGQNCETDDGILPAWRAIRARYQIPICYAEQLLDGVERDLVRYRFDTFEDLSIYCYRVASTVGLMSMRITGYTSQLAVPFAIKLGVALQLTNILRDVGEDWSAGRLYLPLEELEAFGLEEQDIAAAKVDRRWRNFMRFQIARTRQLYAEALPGIHLLHPDGRFAVAAAAMLYRGILDRIEALDYVVFRQRAVVGRGQKLAILGRAFVYARQSNWSWLPARLLPDEL